MRMIAGSLPKQSGNVRQSGAPAARLRRPIPNTINLILAAAHTALNIFQLFIVPLYLLPISAWWGLVLLLTVALSNPLWALIHEAIHSLLSSSRQVNMAVGRLLGIAFGSPFRLLRLPHLLHHKFNRAPTEHGTEHYDPEHTSPLRARVNFYVYILGGAYLLEAFSPLLFLLPKRWLEPLHGYLSGKQDDHGEAVVRHLMTGKGLREMRVDSVAIVLVWGLSAFCYGQYWPLFVAMVLVRACLVSFMDNVYHYRTPLNDVASAHNLRLSPLWSNLLLNTNFHRIHHQRPNISWIALPSAFEQQSDSFDGDFGAVALRQLSGPVPRPLLQPQ